MLFSNSVNIGLAADFGVVFPFLFALVKDLEKEHPGQLADALRVTIDAIVLAHDVLNGFDGAAKIHVRVS